MSDAKLPQLAHPEGELPSVARDLAVGGAVVDTYAGPIHVEWDGDAAVTPLGHLAFFAEYLKLSGRFDALVADCPLTYTSPNAPKVRDLRGTTVLAILAGQWRYAHITALRGDRVNPALLGMSKVVSEDAVRRGLDKIDAEAGARWLCAHFDDTLHPLLSEPWILDCDTTIKPLYGHQEAAVVGYNPHKPGRPSHAFHSFQIAGLRLILAADPRCGSRAGQPAHLQAFRSAFVGKAGPSGAGVLAASGARRQGVGQRAQHGALRAGRGGLPVQATHSSNA